MLSADMAPISVDVKTGELTLWDSKYRSRDVKLGDSPTFAKDSSRNFAIEEASEAIRHSNLSGSLKEKRVFNLSINTFKANAVGAGNAGNSIQSIYVNGKVIGR